MAITLRGWVRYLGGTLFNSDRGMQLRGPDRGSSDAGIAVTDDLAMQIGTVFRCVRIIAEVCALLPVKGYKRLPNGDREELPDSHWLQQLLDHPNEVMSGDQLREALYAQQAGWGNAFGQIVRDSTGIPRELWPYKVDRMAVERNPDLTIDYLYPNAQGTREKLRRGTVMHMRGFTLDGVMGLSPLGMARNAAGLALQAEKYAATFYAAGGVPVGVMKADRVLNPKQREQIRTEYSGMADGKGGQRFWLLEAGLTYDALTVNPEDMQMLLTRSFQVAELARFFGVPLFLLFETEKSTSWGSGIEQQNIALKTYTLAPYAQDMAAAYNNQVIPRELRSKLFVDVDLEALQTADFKSVATYYGGLTDKGIMVRNEARRRLKLPRIDVPQADMLTVQSQFVTIDKVGETPKTPAPAPNGQGDQLLPIGDGTGDGGGDGNPGDQQSTAE